MRMDYTKNEKEDVQLSQILGIVLSATLVAMLILYFLDLININMAVLAILGFGSAILFTSARPFATKYSRAWSGAIKAFAVIFALAFVTFLIYLFVSGVVTL